MASVSYALSAIAVLTVGLAALACRKKGAPSARPYCVVTASMVLWLVGYIWEIEATAVSSMMLAAKVQYLGIATAPVGVFWFAAHYTGRKRLAIGPVLRWAFVLPAITALVAWTNGYHGWLWVDMAPVVGPGWSVLDPTYGPYFWVHVAYSYLCLIAGLGLVVELALRSSGLWFRQSLLLVAGMTAPWIANFLSISGNSPIGALDPTVFAFSFTVVTFAIATFNLRLFSVAPIARDVVLEVIADGIIVLDEREQVVDLNRAAARLLGTDGRALVGTDGRSALGAFSEVLEATTPGSTLRISPDDGESFFDCTKVDVADAGLGPVPVGIVLRDVTALEHSARERRLAHDTLERRVEERTRKLSEAHERLAEEAARRAESQEQLRHAQRLDTIGTFVGGIAHDFNNLLLAILGFSELILADTPEESPSREDLGQVMAAGERARGLVGQILKFSRPTESIQAPLGLHAAVMEALGLLKAIIPASVAIETDFEPALPPVVADAGQIHQVIMNLCANAVHAMPDEGILRLGLRISEPPIGRSRCSFESIEGPAAWVRLDVEDNGHGMDRETREKIFDPFFTTKDETKGTGLGLSVTKGIIEGYGGDIVVRSETGVGTTFSVYLPVSAEAAADVPYEACGGSIETLEPIQSA